MSEPKTFQVVFYPDPILRKESKDVTAFDEDLRATVDGMFDRMFEDKGVGLAAPQVGLSLRILVLNDEGDREKPDRNLTLINPTIKSFSGEKVRFEEGCLSLPDIHCDVTRPDRCVIHAFDVDGNEFELEYEGFISRIIQHEHDHLQGVLLVDRMTPSDKMRNRAAVEELKDRFREARMA